MGSRMGTRLTGSRVATSSDPSKRNATNAKLLELQF